MAKDIEVKVPDIGSYSNVPVIELLVAEGDRVEAEQPLMVLESDKATMEVPAPAAGVIRGLKLKVGDTVSQGDLICLLAEGETGIETGIGNRESGIVEAAAVPPAANAEPVAPSSPVASTAAPTTAPTSGTKAPSLSRVEARVPDIGNYSNVPVIEVLVADGDTVEAEQTLVVLESDKATMEVPAPAAGVVSGLALKVGSTVSQGDLICLLTGSGAGSGAGIVEAAAAPPAAKAEPVAPAPVPVPSAAPSASVSAPAPVDARHAVPYAGPATRLYARKLGVDLAQVKGSGPRGRIVIEDVQGFVKARMSAPTIPDSRFPIPAAGGIPPIPAIDFAQFGPIETQPLARIRKLSAAHLHRCWVNVPHVTQTDEADITDLEDFRKTMGAELAASGGPKLTLLPFVIKAVATAMKQYPEFNASLAPDGESLILKQYCNIGFAADTPNGLVVPVIREVWSKSISQLAAESAELAKKARDGKLKPADMSGGCFSISSLGGIGGSHFTPIVNAPEVGILGVSRSQIKPVWDGKAFQPRLLCPLSLSYDHRVIDGAYAARFIVALGKLLGDLRRLVL